MYQIELRKFQVSDIELFRKWVYEDYVAQWYEDPLDWIYELEHDQDEFHWIEHFIVRYEGKDIGFCQYYEYKLSGEDWHGDIELEDTYSIDYMIGEREYLKKGLGTKIVNLLVKHLFENTKARRIIVQPEEDNKASCNTLLSVGFTYDERNKLYILKEIIC